MGWKPHHFISYQLWTGLPGCLLLSQFNNRTICATVSGEKQVIIDRSPMGLSSPFFPSLLFLITVLVYDASTSAPAPVVSDVTACVVQWGPFRLLLSHFVLSYFQSAFFGGCHSSLFAPFCCFISVTCWAKVPLISAHIIAVGKILWWLIAQQPRFPSVFLLKTLIIKYQHYSPNHLWIQNLHVSLPWACSKTAASSFLHILFRKCSSLLTGCCGKQGVAE